MPGIDIVTVTLAPLGGVPPPQTAFTTLKFKDHTGATQTLTSASAGYTVNADNSASWSWEPANIPNLAPGTTTPLEMT